MELVRQNIHMDHVIGESQVQLALEEDVNLPETKPDVDELCMERGFVVTDEITASTDEVFVRGRLVFSILYHTGEDGGRLVSMEGRIPFEERIRMEGVKPTDHVQVTGEMEDLTVGMINSRKLSVRSVITLTAHADVVCDQEIPVDFEQMEAAQIQFRQVPMEYAQLVFQGNEEVTVREKLTIPSGYANIDEILWKSAETGEMNFRLGDGKLYVQGEVRCFALYTGEEKETPKIYETVVPVSTQIICTGCTEGMTVSVRYDVSGWDLSPEPDEDGEIRCLGLMMNLELGIRIYEEQQATVVTDLYGVNGDVMAQSKEVLFTRVLRSVTGKSRITQQITPDLGADARMAMQINKGDPQMNGTPRILQPIHSEATATLTEITPRKDGLFLRGNMIANVLLSTDNMERPYRCIRTGIPFEYTLEIPGMQPQDRPSAVYCHIEQLSVTLPDEEELDLRAVLSFTTTVFSGSIEEVIDSVWLANSQNDGNTAKPGMVIYVVKSGDKLWDIGKKYNVAVQSLVDQNGLTDIEPDQVLPAGRKLLIIK